MTVRDREAEFKQLFAQEAEQRLTRLGQELLQLEERGSDAELVGSIFRDAHTLKGAAAVVGFDDVGRVAHAMEDLLEQLRSGERLPTPEIVDVLLAAVDLLVELIPVGLAGGSRPDDATAMAARIDAVARGTTPAAAPEIETVELGTDEPATDEAAPLPAAAPAGERRSRAESETVMVPVSRLDELVRLVGESAAAHLRIGRLLGERLGTDPDTMPEFRDMSLVLNELQERTMRARMVPVATITDSLQRAVRDLARAQNKDVRWEVRGGDTELDRGVLQQLADPLLHLVRNAVDHGLEPTYDRITAGKPAQANVRLHAMQLGSEVIITVSDDGKGIDIDKVRAEAARRGDDVSGMTDDEALYLIFRSGLSTAEFISDVSGRGVGLDVVRASVDAARGRMEVRSEPGAGTEFRIIVPITLAVLRCLLVEVGAERYALPMHSVVVAQAADETEDAHAEGRPAVWVGGEPVTASRLAAVLDRPESTNGKGPTGGGQIVVVAGLTRRHAFYVDGLVGQRDVVVKGLSRLLPRLDVLAGASVEPDGSILLVLDAPGLIDRARRSRAGYRAVAPAAAEPLGAPTRRGTILVVDDALTVRELERSILERAGYEVRTASDGLEALARLGEAPVDLVLADVEMPRMDGFALTEAIRAHVTYANLPVLILTSRASEEDRQRGLDAGADGYIVKSAFDETALLGAIERFLGGGR
ncbi:MAG TPA: hybrid sensor histidine kinase/response regulator [Acidimicrobiales bacterium]|nr:hybrid sensor histidine kinase/response regulator [Acidimicrobiales bacterium]